MQVKEMKEVLNAELLCGEENLSLNLESACGADLMSDVMAYVNDKVVLLTGLVNPQVIRTAEMMDIKVVIFVRGKKPDNDIVALAKEKNITILCTEQSMFDSCGKLYSAGVGNGGV